MCGKFKVQPQDVLYIVQLSVLCVGIHKSKNYCNSTFEWKLKLPLYLFQISKKIFRNYCQRTNWVIDLRQIQIYSCVYKSNESLVTPEKRIA